MKAYLVYNPTKVDDVDALRTTVEKACAEKGWEPPVLLETTKDDPGAGMARQAVEERADLVLSAGGDGTVMAVAAGLTGSGVSLGILPLGTGNLLARNLDLPLAVDEALEIALTGTDRTIDLGSSAADGADAKTFAVMAGVGFDAAMMKDAPEKVKEKLGWAAYLISGFQHLRDHAITVRLKIDDQPELTRRVRSVIVGNVGELQGGLTLLPDAVPHDGKLDVVVLQPTRHLDWLRVIGRLITHHKKEDSELERFSGKRIEIRLTSPQPSQLDGDPQDEVTKMILEVMPDALVVRVPQPAP
ncbi:MAG: diacylglycerol kinase family protein [Mycobacteriales bacterium]